MQRLVLTSKNVLLPGNATPQPATVEVDCDTGKIIRVMAGIDSGGKEYNDSRTEVCDLGDLVLLPGLVDAHVHLNEPGRTTWEGFYSGTRAAVAGGFTTVVDMPLNSIPPTTTVKNLQLKRQAAQGQCWSDVAFWGGVIPHNQGDLRPLVDAGVKGFKCFLIESGVEEFPHVTDAEVKLAMEQLESTATVLLFHAEIHAEPMHNAELEELEKTSYYTFLQSRPDAFEFSAIELVIAANKLHPSLRTHIVHLSSATALPLIREAKDSGLPITVETCFHYLTLSASEVPAGHPEFKCCPPIRSSANREELWEALKDGTIDFVVSDHSPCISSLKCLDTGDIMKAWGGIGGLGLGLSLLWTEGRKRNISLGSIVAWLSGRPAKHADLSSKGAIEPGKDADFVIFDPDAEFKVSRDSLHFRNKISPYEGLTLTGRVIKTILRGKVVWDSTKKGEKFGNHPVGRLL